jgi:hypothetical protein
MVKIINIVHFEHLFQEDSTSDFETLLHLDFDRDNNTVNFDSGSTIPVTDFVIIIKAFMDYYENLSSTSRGAGQITIIPEEDAKEVYDKLQAKLGSVFVANHVNTEIALSSGKPASLYVQSFGTNDAEHFVELCFVKYYNENHHTNSQNLWDYICSKIGELYLTSPFERVSDNKLSLVNRDKSKNNYEYRIDFIPFVIKLRQLYKVSDRRANLMPKTTFKE